MAVMAALMALARDGRAVRAAGEIRDRQPVQFAAQQHARAGNAAVVKRRDTMPAQTGDDRVGRGVAQHRGHGRGGALFLAGKLGMAVQVAPPFGQLGNIGIAEAGQGAGGGHYNFSAACA